MTRKLRIVFMGTPTFAVTVLDRIFNSEHQIVGIVTAPDRPSGRGQQIRSFLVIIILFLFSNWNFLNIKKT